ncbi:MAG: hybrid sensor histidine kinase/response regulator [Oculatellaceae cyanobacterium Prado106]|nr:hybrid sensor histidine kinase/response regulator [Oculatellaceae cyanobacterium Prado106]
MNFLSDSQYPPQGHGSILIVDDMPDNLRFLSKMLSSQGYHVQSAISGSAAFMAVSTRSPDLILLDQSLKANPQTRDIPVLFLSAFQETIDKVKAFQVGGLDYITKPFQIEEVLARVETHLTLSRTQKALQSAKAETLKALQQEQQLNRLKSEFMAMVTHDFHTPLVSIQGFASLLQQDDLLQQDPQQPPKSPMLSPETRQRYFSKIESSIDHLRHLLEQVLLIGQSDSGKLQCHPTEFDLEPFCQELIEWFPDHHRAIEFRYQCDRPSVLLDQTLLRQILINILTNAIKYSPTHTPIYFTVEQIDNAILFTVQDFGIGIPPEEQSRLFEPFFRGSNVQAFRSSGLGLAVVKTCVDTHGGDIEVISQVDQGTTVVVTLPAKY